MDGDGIKDVEEDEEVRLAIHRCCQQLGGAARYRKERQRIKTWGKEYG